LRPWPNPSANQRRYYIAIAAPSEIRRPYTHSSQSTECGLDTGSMGDISAFGRNDCHADKGAKEGNRANTGPFSGACPFFPSCVETFVEQSAAEIKACRARTNTLLNPWLHVLLAYLLAYLLPRLGLGVPNR
jgi:hypothetical protein